MAVLADFPEKCRNQILPIESKQHYISEAPAQVPSGFYNEQGNWVAEPPSPSPSIQTVHSLSSCAPSHSGHSRHSSRKSIQNFRPRKECHNLKFLSEKPSRRLIPPEMQFLTVQVFKCMQTQWKKQPMRQNSTNSSSSSVLQVSQQSLRDQDIQTSTKVSVQSFRDTETNP